MPSTFRQRLSGLLAALPVIIMMTFMNVFITFAVSGVVMIELAAAGHSRIALGAAILTAVIVYTWIVFNHKLRNYIKNQESPE
jgi:hypothetical protein